MRVRQTGALAGLVDYRALIPSDRLAERRATVAPRHGEALASEAKT